MKKTIVLVISLLFSASVFAGSNIQKIDQRLSQYSWHNGLLTKNKGPYASYNTRFDVVQFLHKKKVYFAPETKYCSYTGEHASVSTCYIGEKRQNDGLLSALKNESTKKILKQATLSDF